VIVRLLSLRGVDMRVMAAMACLLLLLPAWSAPSARQGSAVGPSALEKGLMLTPLGKAAPEHLDLAAALDALEIPSVSMALIDHGKVAWARAYGRGASTHTLYQAASLSKLVTAVAVLRLVEERRLDLDRDVDDELLSWHLSESDLTRGHPVTLRGLLSMTGGIGVPGYLGYEPGAPLPSLLQILTGTPPANSPPVRVKYVPGSRYAYSGGGYEIVQLTVQEATRQSFGDALDALVFRPAGMANSFFAQPLPRALVARAAKGHRADGTELPGGWRVVPELAAGGLWSTPTDLAKLLIDISRAYRGESNPLLSRKSARAMFRRQNGGHYGLGGAVNGSSRSLALMKRGQNIGYQSYMLVFPETGQGMIVMTGSDNGTVLATALIHRAAVVYGWPPLGDLPD
jgi:CubicO group peptidase (beta-lactamase class C family)